MTRYQILAREIIEPRDGGVELKIDGAGWPVALLANDDFGFTVDCGHFGLPLDVLVRTRARLLVAEVIFFAEHEQYDVRVLLDRSRFTQIRQLRPLVVAVLDLPRQLRQRQNRYIDIGRTLLRWSALAPVAQSR